MMHKQWKKELRNITLSDSQKAKMKIAMQQPHTYKKPLAPRIIFPAFIVFALFFIMWKPNRSGLSSAAESIVFDDITLRIVIWLTISQLLLVIGYLFAITCIRNVKRWDNRPLIQRLRVLLNMWQGHVIGTLLLLAMMAVMWIVTLIVPNTLVAEAFFTMSFLFFFVSILTYFTRRANKGKCPYCNTYFSYRQLLKLGFKLTPICPICGEKMAPKTYHGADSASYVWVPALMLLQYTTLYYWYVVALFVAGGLFIVLYILPYRTEYMPLQKDDLPPPLW
ncbi:hypothetical protein [Caryophanon latum]|uniref:Uncharacterized protein n=1 Tax=Caryophanon latum TaxID=33977 RepID=A0A1C0YV64_9BACL|nr:hypothetical protein [Caryophanon latum]OCS91041.1 hypothetical protein A6K76_09870 [Caryophanon latum]